MLEDTTWSVVSRAVQPVSDDKNTLVRDVSAATAFTGALRIGTEGVSVN